MCEAIVDSEPETMIFVLRQLGAIVIASSLSVMAIASDQQERDLLGKMTCDLDYAATVAYELFEPLPDPRFAMEYRKMKSGTPANRHLLLLVEKGPLRESKRCDRILAIQPITLSPGDFVAIACTGKGNKPLAKLLVVGIGQTPPPRRNDNFVARHLWSIDLEKHTFKPLRNRLVVCVPKRAPEE